jgi:hypothetical protein
MVCRCLFGVGAVNAGFLEYVVLVEFVPIKKVGE